MIKKEFEQDDPFELVGMVVNVDDHHLEEMGRCFIEEFLSMGYPKGAVAHLFRSPFYQGPHLVYRTKGEAYVRELIDRIHEQRK